jgi:hypothetical protein
MRLLPFMRAPHVSIKQGDRQGLQSTLWAYDMPDELLIGTKGCSATTLCCSTLAAYIEDRIMAAEHTQKRLLRRERRRVGPRLPC